jgi:hypothetical protein
LNWAAGATIMNMNVEIVSHDPLKPLASVTLHGAGV